MGNSYGVFPVAAASVGGAKNAQIVNSVIPAGSSINLLQAGDNFYLTVATAAVFIAPLNGTYNQYTQGTGLRVDPSAEFKGVQIRNDNAFNVVISIFIGYGGYIDNRLIPFNPLVVTVAYPTYPVPNVAANVLIPDLSGNAIVDLNGNIWLALQRTAIFISNLETASVYFLANTNATKSAVVIQPKTEIVVPFNGNFSLNNGVSNINGIISESYLAISPSQ